MTPPATLGRSGCSVNLIDNKVAPLHARVIERAGEVQLEPVAAVLLNGSPASGPQALRNGDRLTVGNTELTIFGLSPVTASSAGPASASQVPVLVGGTAVPAIPAPGPTLFPSPPTALAPQPQRVVPITPGLKFRGKTAALTGQVKHIDGPVNHKKGPGVGSAILFLPLFLLALWRSIFWVLLFRGGDTEAVRHVRVEETSGRQCHVRMAGEPTHGLFSLGDTVSFWGYTQKGTLHMLAAYVHDTYSWVRIKGIYDFEVGWRWLAGGVALVAVVLLIASC